MAKQKMKDPLPKPKTGSDFLTIISRFGNQYFSDQIFACAITKPSPNEEALSTLDQE